MLVRRVTEMVCAGLALIGYEKLREVAEMMAVMMKSLLWSWVSAHSSYFLVDQELPSTRELVNLTVECPRPLVWLHSSWSQPCWLRHYLSWSEAIQSEPL